MYVYLHRHRKHGLGLEAKAQEGTDESEERRQGEESVQVKGRRGEG